MKKTIRQSVTISAEHLPVLEYLCDKLGKSRSALVSDMLDETLPGLYEMVKSFEETVKKGDTVKPKEIVLTQALRMMADLIEREQE